METSASKKKKKAFNLIMVAVIAAVLAVGVFAAVSMRAPDDRLDALGSATESKSLDFSVSKDNPWCTIEIRCDTILDNVENLDEAKAPYVPENGVILIESEMEFTEGETAFDVLKRACSAADIQLEYSWTPIYDSYYIEGINHLYEFDCGGESGWAYLVNGDFPNYGASGYELETGDKVAWLYSCNGLGEDVGASVL